MIIDQRNLSRTLIEGFGMHVTAQSTCNFFKHWQYVFIFKILFTKPSHKVYYRCKLYAFKCGLNVGNNRLMVWFLQRSPHLTFAVLCDDSIRLTNYVRSSGVTQTEITWSRPIWQNRHGRGESVRRARRDAIASECVRASVRPADLINYHQMYPHLSTLRLRLVCYLW